ncbi:MAG TPA: chemotaxis protein CheW [Luteitalea sp.]|nr:chemotaxis protein CheW [Luteitalea sp.]
MTPIDSINAIERPGPPRQVATFVLADMYFGVEVEKVQEVLKFQQMTRIPLAPPVVRGLINLRGQIVTAVELRRRLGLAERPSGALPMNVVVRTTDGLASLLVDEIGDVLEVEAAQFEPTPDTLTGPARDLVRGVFKLKNQLLLLLDEERAAMVDPAHSGSRGC